MMIVVFFMACETGTRYDKNETVKVDAPSGVANRTHTSEIEALLKDRDGPEIEEEFDDDLHPIVLEEDRAFITQENSVKRTFSGGKTEDGLEVKSIREGRHEHHIRLVLDVYKDGKVAQGVGNYKAQYNFDTNDIVVTLNGYRKFTPALPSFSQKSEIEKIYFDNYLDDSGYKFHIKLRYPSTVKVFDLKNPARLVFDIKAI